MKLWSKFITLFITIWKSINYSIGFAITIFLSVIMVLIGGFFAILFIIKDKIINEMIFSNYSIKISLKKEEYFSAFSKKSYLTTVKTVKKTKKLNITYSIKFYFCSK